MISTKEIIKTRLHKKILIVLMVAFLSFAGLVMVRNYFEHKEPKKVQYAIVPSKAGKGGSPLLVVQYHNEAVQAWKVGDKPKASSLAKQGLAANDQLTIEQQRQVPNQLNIVSELAELSLGRYYGQ